MSHGVRPAHSKLAAVLLTAALATPGYLAAQSPPDAPPPTPLAIPEHNRANLREPPPLPGPGDLEERARVLFQAIVADDPSPARDFFLSREAFRAVKGIADPDTLWDRIFRAYEEDIHELHAQLGADAAEAEFVRFELSRRRGWVVVREESNRLPYWAQRHSWLVYRVRGEERRFEVRTMIAWDDRWYITHLNEFRQPAR
jgi:hypothetical protein